MNCYIIVSNKDWHIKQFNELKSKLEGNWHFINSPEGLDFNKIKNLNPKYIFFLHWSTKIHENIYSNFNCVLFHMTELPYGRGGSPLQNLIIRKHKHTKISAIKVTNEIDAGDVYLKNDLNLNGTAQEILSRAAEIIKNMIIEIISKNPTPIAQTGEPVVFKRRKPAESNIQSLDNITVLYDYIRMLDADGYPNAFLETEHFKFEFNKAELNPDNTLSAHVRIIKK